MALITHNFEIRLTKRLTWDDACPPGHRYFKRDFFEKNLFKKVRHLGEKIAVIQFVFVCLVI